MHARIGMMRALNYGAAESGGREMTLSGKVFGHERDAAGKTLDRTV
jgi:hypothetical protein